MSRCGGPSVPRLLTRPSCRVEHGPAWAVWWKRPVCAEAARFRVGSRPSPVAGGEPPRPASCPAPVPGLRSLRAYLALYEVCWPRLARYCLEKNSDKIVSWGDFCAVPNRLGSKIISILPQSVLSATKWFIDFLDCF